MKLIELKERQDVASDLKLSKIYSQFGELLSELKMKALTQDILDFINECTENLNSSSLTGNEFIKLVKQKQVAILKQVEKQLKLVPKNHYRNLWMLFGMSGIGLPIGVTFGLSVGNMGLLGIGLPIGMMIGLAIGITMDKKALSEGKQLNFESKY